MKNTCLAIVFLLITMFSFGQRKERQDRIKALKIAFITEKLELTKGEAEKFWPVYNALEDEKERLRKESRSFRKGLDFETITDSDAKLLLKNMQDMEDKKHSLYTRQVNDLLNVIPAKKIIMLNVVEDQFNRRMLEEIKKRRSKNND
ncbi:MAG: sensor of ECF-type sigma factor [Psychroserpens sp.]|uniref:sensor of ECF-type sigma factor n=1 Tax=Psychroserpens sp. TaxID=2020870 RepID=UPI003C784315